MKRIYKAIILNDYPLTPYAEWVRIGKKKIETRMNRLFTYRGDIVICCGETNSIGDNRGLALCIVNIYDGMPMQKEHAEAACIGWDKDRKSLLLKDWRYFNRNFIFKTQKVSGSFQAMFDIVLPDDIEIIPQPQILPYKLPEPTQQGKLFAA